MSQGRNQLVTIGNEGVVLEEKLAIAVDYTLDVLLPQATQLADRLHLKFSKEAPIRLCVTEVGLCLNMPGFSALKADFNWQTWALRRKEGGQGLISACKPKAGLSIIDATAGWGRDAALLSLYGAKVKMIERNPVMGALLSDALAHQDERSMQKMALSMIEMDAISYLTLLKPDDYPDIIYLDPMHPLRVKSALVKKNMQALQQLIGPDEDALKLLTIARERVRTRVVVKWPVNQPALLKPSSSIVGKTVRFDIYTPQ